MNWQAERKKSALETLRRLRLDSPNSSPRLAILAAHPDDETIGASALLARFPNAAVVFLTDGAPKDRNLWPADMRGLREDYAELRRREAAKALAHAGIAENQICWLGAVDQEAIFAGRELAVKFAELMRELRPNLVMTHPYEGGHPDHDCAALIAPMALSTLSRRAPGVERPVLCEMTSYHARNGQCVTGEFLESDPAWETVFEFSEEDRGRKRIMMDEYKSQRLVLENFPIAAERMRVAPKYDFSQPPHEGKLWYECMKWPMTGQCWRELAALAFSQQECSCA